MQWRISLSDIDLGEEEITVVNKVLRSKWLTMGEVTQEFEKKLAEYLGVKYAFAVTNGTAALHMAYKVLGIREGDEVICPSFTFVATANAVLYTGAVPIFADIISLDNLNISPERILEKIGQRTRAITVVHYGGYPCHMDEIMEIARKCNLYVIEDAAHAIGAEYKGKKCGTIADVGCFSFFSNKNMTTGEGGAIVTNNDDLAEKIRIIRSHGMTSLTLDRYKGHAYTYDVVDLGYNYRIDEIRAAIGLVQLEKLDSNNKRRMFIVDQYCKALENIPEITIPFKKFEEMSAYHIYPVIIDEGKRDDIMRNLKSQGIQTSIHYPPIHLFKYYSVQFGYKEGLLLVTEQAGKREITLPLSPLMKEKDVEYIAEKIREQIETSRR